MLIFAGCSTGGDAAPEPVDAAPTTTEAPATTSTSSVTTTSVPLDTRSALRARLEVELDDTALAATVVGRVDDWLLPRIERMTDGDIMGSACCPTRRAPQRLRRSTPSGSSPGGSGSSRARASPRSA